MKAVFDESTLVTARAYEPPRVETLGSVYELTRDFCIFNKTIGSPDYWSRIPIANCST